MAETKTSKVIFYKICCKNPEIKDVYVGRTTNIIKRRHSHKTNCTNSKGKKYNIFVYTFIRENGGWTNWEVVPIEEQICDSNVAAAARERYHLETLGATLNKVIPGQSLKEYRAKNADYIKERQRKYNIENVDAIKNYNNANADYINKRRREYRARKRAQSA